MQANAPTVDGRRSDGICSVVLVAVVVFILTFIFFCIFFVCCVCSGRIKGRVPLTIIYIYIYTIYMKCFPFFLRPHFECLFFVLPTFLGGQQAGALIVAKINGATVGWE